MEKKEEYSFWTVFIGFFSLRILLCVLLFPSYISTDFDVHRNWLSIVHNLPLSEWYFESKSEWTLDYPPFFAYFEWILAQFASPFSLLWDEKMLEISSSPYQSLPTKIFQRSSVIFSDIILFYSLYRYTRSVDGKIQKFGMISSILMNFGLIIIDHIHFQYNGMLFGIFILSLCFMKERSYIKSGIVFAIALHFKHIHLYYAPSFFIFLLSQFCLEGNRFHWKRFVSLGSAVFVVFLASLGPFLAHGFDQITQMISRMFPFGRGLCHAYWAPNFWALYNASDRFLAFFLRKFVGFQVETVGKASSTGGLVGEIDHLVLPSITPKISLLLVFLSIIPILYKLFRKPSFDSFNASVVMCALSFYMFGWHVHEKAILMVILPLTLLAFERESFGRVSFILTLTGHFSLFPLIFTMQETPIKISLFLFHSCISYYFLAELNPKFHLRFWESLYLIGFIPLQLFYGIFHPIFFNNLPFLSLMLISVYCSIGIIYSNIYLYYEYFKL
eukprot:TRINITY_DN7841_c0_g1_i1.p1 TRINITY_DN7841_c0_g1~~TRINITY_DN7841_c0_g1_i1.p1  ORF type:complete len:501 (-),score=146.60 TRINITY_DN7841_c0_g1_i1:197-1699(-)